MPRDFVPTRDSELVTFSNNVSTKITATPTAYGLTAALATAYTAKSTAFISAYQTASNPDTRSPSNIIAKDMARAALVEDLRMLARIVQATPSVTPDQKSELGLTVRDVEPSPVPVPGHPPVLSVLSVMGRTVRIQLKESAESTRRGKPAGVAGATVLSYVGDEAPADTGLWKFEGNMSRTSIDVEFPVTVAAGAKIWLTAFWFNPRAESGPACAPVSTNLQFGGAMAA